MPDEGNVTESIALYLEEARWRRDDQNHRVRGLNQKLAAASVLNAGVVAVFAASLSLSEVTLPSAAAYIFYAALATFSVNVATSAYAYLISNWSRRPSLSTLRRHLSNHTYESVALWAADQIYETLGQNEETISRKSRWVTISIVLSALTVLLIGATAGVAFAPA